MIGLQDFFAVCQMGVIRVTGPELFSQSAPVIQMGSVHLPDVH
ncbi:hypothetical protein LTSEADE_2280 [Salmonella enterica subsp. enterica serovar Adelaide str. A4-669]|uniref:Uncharacterized protein n=1 Tax=Salmonella enterica subsp. enterica serovar Adelaide str. A4-669 TaxID=913063 RepID=A0A6C8GMS7_SALET|nr:hypothetical protein LTSEADE_2280 [Salmonella enterica subsp. enterica serovar Adelaide str. A4-669]